MNIVVTLKIMKVVRTISNTKNVSTSPIRFTRAFISSTLYAHQRILDHTTARPSDTKTKNLNYNVSTLSSILIPSPHKITLTLSYSFQLANSTHSNQSAMPCSPTIHPLYEPQTGTWQYIVADPSTREAVIIDSVLDYDPSTRTISTQSADTLLSLITNEHYTISRILETHIHADHLTAASYLASRFKEKQGFKPPICIGKRITQVQVLFGKKYGINPKEYEGAFDYFFDDGEEFFIGDLAAKTIHLPGHTPDHIGYIIGDNVFSGDSLFHPSLGTARCDFPGGNASALFQSSRKLLSLPGNTKIWTGHDYPSKERGVAVPWTSVMDHKDGNKHVRNGVKEDEFVEMRQERDGMLGEPRLLHESLQVNVRAGRLPGERMLCLPVKVEGGLKE
jgi:glyoxylase-like metal-dependent hydrolase (beta-lactamase superfamily II)